MRYHTRNMKHLILLETNQINDCKVKQKIVQTNERIYCTYTPDFMAPYFEAVGYFHNRWRERLGSTPSATSQMTATNYIHHVRISVECSYVQHLHHGSFSIWTVRKRMSRIWVQSWMLRENDYELSWICVGYRGETSITTARSAVKTGHVKAQNKWEGVYLGSNGETH
jgi:hypothetical protein